MSDGECKMVIERRIRPAIEAGRLHDELDSLKDGGLIHGWSVISGNILVVFPQPKCQTLRLEVTA